MALATAIVFATPLAPIGTAGTVLGIRGTKFTVQNRPVFLLGISYYGGLGASDDTLRRDLDALRGRGFNWLRVWATWSFRGADVSAVDALGKPRQPYLDRLVRFVGECDGRGLIVDVTLTRKRGATSGGLRDMASHEQAVRTIVGALRSYRNWYLDLANERDVGDDRFVPIPEIRQLRQLARELFPELLVTASFGGHDLDDNYVRQALLEADLDFVAPHRPRHAGSPAQTEKETRSCLDAMRRLRRMAPIHYQEPFRRGYGDWQPLTQDFLTDLQGAVLGGAAGWCLHNGSTRGAADERPWRSFDLREQDLFSQLDGEELAVVNNAAETVRTAQQRTRGSG